MANDYMSDDPWLDSGGEHDAQHVSLTSLSRRLARAEQEMRRMRTLMAEHGILDSNSDAQSPHPNLDVASLKFGGGSGEIGPLGIQMVESKLGPSYPLSISWKNDFQTTWDGLSSFPKAELTGETDRVGTAPYLNAIVGSGLAERSVLTLTADATQSTFGLYTDQGGVVSGIEASNDGTEAFLNMTGAVTINQATRTIAAGVISAQAASNIKVDTQSSAATDDLDTITGRDYGLLILHAASSARTVVVKHGTGNIRLDGSTDFSLDNEEDMILLFYKGETGNWCEISRSNNGA